MKKVSKRTYQIRRLVAAFILVGLLLAFTTSVLIKTDVFGKVLDAEFSRQDAVLEEHWELWRSEK